jgi:hypothetical protein
MKYLSNAYVYLVFYGDHLDPTEFSERLGVSATRTGITGEKGKYGATLKDTFWEYRMKETNALEELDESLYALKEIFEGKIEIIQEYVAEKNIRSKCYIVIKCENNEDVGVALENEFISFICRIRMQVEVDVYNNGPIS